MSQVSIIIPVRDGENYILEAIESAFNQSAFLKEVIVVDDGSVDSTLSKLKSLNDGRLNIICRPEGAKSGVSAARNHGARVATGEWLLFLDSDDRLRENALSTLINTADPQTVAVYGDYERINASGRAIGRRGLIRRRHKPSGRITENLLAGNFIVNGGIMLIKKTAFDKIEGFNENLRFCEDWHTWTRLSLEGSVTYAPKHVLDYRVYSASVTMASAISLLDAMPAVTALFSDKAIVTAVPPERLAQLRVSALAHLNDYAICQTIRSKRFAEAFVGLWHALKRNPKRFLRTLLVSGAALAGI